MVSVNSTNKTLCCSRPGLFSFYVKKKCSGAIYEIFEVSVPVARPSDASGSSLDTRLEFKHSIDWIGNRPSLSIKTYTCFLTMTGLKSFAEKTTKCLAY